MINEGLSMSTVGLMTVQFAAEKQYIKKYIISRFNNDGIKVKAKITYGGKNYDKSKIRNDFFEGFDIYTYDEGLASTGKDMDLSNFDIHFKTQGNKVNIKYSLYNNNITKSIIINNITTNKFMDKVLSFYYEAKEKLLQIHKDNHANKRGQDYQSEADSLRMQEIADGFNYKGCKIKYRNSNYGYRKKQSFVLDMKYPPSKESDNKYILATLIKRLFQDPTIKRYMDKDDKLDKDFRWDFSYSAPQFKKNYGFVKEAIAAFVDYIEKISDIYIDSMKYGGLEIYISLGDRKGMKSYNVKKEMITGINSQIKQMNREFDRMIGRASKYGKLIIKRFFAKSGEYI